MLQGRVAQDITIQGAIGTLLHHLQDITVVITIITTAILVMVITTITIIVYGTRGDTIAMVVTTIVLSVTVTIVIDISIAFLDTTSMVVLIDQQGLRLEVCLLQGTMDSFRFRMAQAIHI